MGSRSTTAVGSGIWGMASGLTMGLQEGRTKVARAGASALPRA